MKAMKKRLLTLFMIINMSLVLSGCSSKAEQEAALRDEGIALMDEGDYTGAIEQFDEALALSIGEVTALEIDINYYKAAAQFQGDLFDDAVETYSGLIYYDKDNYKPYFLRGSIYAREGELSKALEDYDSAIEHDEDNYLLYIQIYENLSDLGNEDQGQAYLSQALELKDKSAEGSYYKGRIYFMLNEYDKAKEYLQKAVDKDVVEAKLYLAKLYQAQDDWTSAQTLLEEYASSDDVNSEALGALGDIEISNGNYESALSYYIAGLGLDNITNYTQLCKGEVVALEHLNRFDEAETVLTEYLDKYPSDEEAARELVFVKTR